MPRGEIPCGKDLKDFCEVTYLWDLSAHATLDNDPSSDGKKNIEGTTEQQVENYNLNVTSYGQFCYSNIHSIICIESLGLPYET